MTKLNWNLIVASLLIFFGLATPLHGKKIDLDAATLKKWGEAGYVFTAKLQTVIAGPVALSRPPIYSHRLEFVVESVIRGPVKKGDKLTCSHSARQMQKPTFPQGKTCLVSATLSRGRVIAKVVEEATVKIVAQAKLACSIPIGWSVKDGNLISPWAALQGNNGWAENEKLTSDLRCSKTNRPVLSCGNSVAFTVAKVPPAKEIKWTNPDGDGQYKIIVTNTTKQTVEVPALLTGDDGKTILWDQSIVILCQGKTYTIAGAKPIKGKAQAYKLAPGKSVSSVVNALKLQGPKWPRGGYRIAFQFALGEYSSTQSFYYMSRHHDKIRAAALKN